MSDNVLSDWENHSVNEPRSSASIQKEKNKFNKLFPVKSLQKQLSLPNYSNQKSLKLNKGNSLPFNFKYAKRNNYIQFTENIFDFATVKNKVFLNLLAEKFPTYYTSSKGIYYLSKFKHIVPANLEDLMNIYYNLTFVDTYNKTFTFNLKMELEHSFNYFLVTLRFAPLLIEKFYNNIYLNYYDYIFNNISKSNYEIFDCENLMRHKATVPKTKEEAVDFFNKHGFSVNSKDTFKTYVLKNFDIFISASKEFYTKSTRFEKKFYSFDIFRDIRGRTDNYVEVITNYFNKTINNEKITDYEFKNINEHDLSPANILNNSGYYKDGEKNISIPLAPGNLNIYVERSRNNIECIIIQIPQLTSNYGSFIRHGLDDLLIKFLKTLYDSIYINKKQKKMHTEFGVKTLNQALTPKTFREFDNNSGILKTYQRLKVPEVKVGKHTPKSIGFEGLQLNDYNSSNSSTDSNSSRMVVETNEPILKGYNKLSRKVNRFMRNTKQKQKEVISNPLINSNRTQTMVNFSENRITRSKSKKKKSSSSESANASASASASASSKKPKSKKKKAPKGKGKKKK